MITYANKCRDFKVIVACNACKANRLEVITFRNFFGSKCFNCNSSQLTLYLPYKRNINKDSEQIYDSYSLAKSQLNKIQHKSLSENELNNLFKYIDYKNRCVSCNGVIFYRLNFSVKMLNDRTRICDFFFPNYFSLHLYEVYADQCLVCGRETELLSKLNEIKNMRSYMRDDIYHHQALAHRQNLKDEVESTQPSLGKIDVPDLDLNFDLLDTDRFNYELANLLEAYHRAKDDYDHHLKYYDDVWHYE